MSGNGVLRFDDAQSAADFRTFVVRAKRLDADGAARLQAMGGVLAVWVCAVQGSGLMGDGVALGLRTYRLGDELRGEWCPSLAALTDRFAHEAADTVPLPPVDLTPMWAAQTPPRTGWEPVGAITLDDVQTIAVQGIDRIKNGEDPEHVWSEPLHDVPGGLPLRAGAAFAAHSLGFTVGVEAQLLHAGRWSRLSTPAGHVLTR